MGGHHDEMIRLAEREMKKKDEIKKWEAMHQLKVSQMITRLRMVVRGFCANYQAHGMERRSADYFLKGGRGCQSDGPL